MELPFLPTFLTVLGLLFGFPTLGPSLRAADPVFAKNTDTRETWISTGAYEATVGSDGMLISYKSHGVESLWSVPDALPRGLYLYQGKGIVNLPDSSWQATDTLVAKGAAGSLSYHFDADSVEVVINNTSDAGMVLYIMLAEGVKKFVKDDGSTMVTPVDLKGQRDTSWLNGQERFDIKLDSNDADLSEWGGHQLLTIGFSPGGSHTVVLASRNVTGAKTTATPRTGPIASPMAAQPEQPDVPSAKPQSDGNVSQDFLRAHASFLERIKAGPAGVVFFGDSITNRWREDNVKTTWAKFAPYTPANFGIEGDKTQHVLWRLANGEANSIQPKVAVVLIGTNNMTDPADGIVRGVTAVVRTIHQKLPQTKVLLLSILPRGEMANDPVRTKIKQINAALARLDDRRATRVLDLGPELLSPDGYLAKEIAPDALHLSPKGYEIWAAAMLPLLDEMYHSP